MDPLILKNISFFSENVESKEIVRNNFIRNFNKNVNITQIFIQYFSAFEGI